jgi:KDO2-lipid IV(A) lauroyltransferase
MKSFAYAVENALFKIAATLLKWLPESFGYALAGFFGWVGFWLIKKRRDITIRNLGYAFPEKNAVDLRKLALQSYVNMAKTFVEIFWTERLYRQGRIKIDNQKNLDDVLSRGKGVIIATLHSGNWEAATAIAAFGYRFYAVSRRQNNPLFDLMMSERRALFGFEMIYKGEGARKFLKCLRRDKGILVLIMDQHDNDVAVEFFGQQTTAPGGAAVLAAALGSPIVMAHAYRDEQNNHHIIIGKEINPVDNTDEKQMIQATTQEIYREFETIIRQHPEQYFWQHNRFK